MTVQQFLEQQLVECGLWPDQATQVVSTMRGKMATVPDDADYDQIKALIVDAAEASSLLKAVKFDSPVDAYPKAFLAVMLMVAKQYAVKWLDANAPQHFARALLAV